MNTATKKTELNKPKKRTKKGKNILEMLDRVSEIVKQHNVKPFSRKEIYGYQ